MVITPFLVTLPCQMPTGTDWARRKDERLLQKLAFASLLLQEQRVVSVLNSNKAWSLSPIPAAFGARGSVRGTTNRSHSHPHSYSLITAWNKKRKAVKVVLCRAASPPQTSFRLSNQVCWPWKSTRLSVSHPGTQNQSWQQAVVYGMYPYELWNLGALQVVFLPLICSQSKAAVILGPLAREQLSGNPNISHYNTMFSLIHTFERFRREISRLD